MIGQLYINPNKINEEIQNAVNTAYTQPSKDAIPALTERIKALRACLKSF